MKAEGGRGISSSSCRDLTARGTLLVGKGGLEFCFRGMWWACQHSVGGWPDVHPLFLSLFSSANNGVFLPVLPVFGYLSWDLLTYA